MSTLTVPHATPQRSLGTEAQKTKGWISRATYDSLPPIFQASARDLVKKGRIEIEDIPRQPDERKLVFPRDAAPTVRVKQ